MNLIKLHAHTTRQREMDSHESMEAKEPVQDSTVGVCIVGKKEFKRKTHQGLVAGHGLNAITTSGRTLSSISRGCNVIIGVYLNGR